VTPPANCRVLIPDSWKQPVPGAALPRGVDLTPFLGKPLDDRTAAIIAAPYANAFLSQTDKLSIANGRTSDTVEIVSKCEELANQARAR
jgi:hypothetical protein